jgi:hypothetical protein
VHRSVATTEENVYASAMGQAIMPPHQRHVCSMVWAKRLQKGGKCILAKRGSTLVGCPCVPWRSDRDGVRWWNWWPVRAAWAEPCTEVCACFASSSAVRSKMGRMCIARTQARMPSRSTSPVYFRHKHVRFLVCLTLSASATLWHAFFFFFTS